MQKDISAIRKLLTIIAIPLVLYILNILSVIAIPLAFGMFLALLFTPFQRWLMNRKIPRIGSLFFILIIVSIGLLGAYKLVEASSLELTRVDDKFIATMESRLNQIAKPIAEVLKIEPEEKQSYLSAILNNEKVVSNIFENLTGSIAIARDLLTMLLMSIFFMLLFLMDSVSIKKVLELFIFKQEEASASTYRQIEKDVFSFISVKMFTSLLTGLGIGLACYFFGISFPIFWGIAAFLLNFIQVIGSALVTVSLMIFALVELNFSGFYIFFVAIILGMQTIVGVVLEPILMGKSFSINTITIIVMLSVWGVIWGIPGMILSVPITALVKTILDQFPETQKYSEIMS